MDHPSTTSPRQLIAFGKVFMHIDQMLQRCAVLGAASHTGRHITLQLLREIALNEVISYGSTETGKYKLILIDSNKEALISLKTYLNTQLANFAHTHIDSLRHAYAADAHLIDNTEIIKKFIQGVMDSLTLSAELASATSAYLIFDCLPEDLSLKSNALKTLHKHSQHSQYYLNNTSCIPIYLLNEHAELNGSIIGFHFCEPSLQQDLIEIIPLQETNSDLNICARALGARLNKTIVQASDFPGFISNGYLMREIAFALQIVEELVPIWNYVGAIYAIEWITKYLLVRERGIFQQMDYIGIEHCSQTASMMSSLLNDNALRMPFLSILKVHNKSGGQDDAGNQLPGFFLYQDGIPSAIYDIKTGEYVSWTDSSLDRVRKELSVPSMHLPSWQELIDISAEERIDILHAHFQQITRQSCMGHQLALYYLANNRLIANALFSSGVATTLGDIDTVLRKGFGHLYSPLETWLPCE